MLKLTHGLMSPLGYYKTITPFNALRGFFCKGNGRYRILTTQRSIQMIHHMVQWLLSVKENVLYVVLYSTQTSILLVMCTVKSYYFVKTINDINKNNKNSSG